MLRWIDSNKISWRSGIIFLAPMGLWGMLWLSISSGDSDVKLILAPDSVSQFIGGIRSVFPFAAAAVALSIILFGLKGRRSRGVLFFSPMGFAAAYGVVGVIGSIVSLDRSQALYWSVAYLSVPLVLWGLVWRREMVSYLGQLVGYTGWVIALIVAILFVVALVKFDLGSSVINPSKLAECNIAIQGDWGRLTSGILRSTGVGRYAAIGAIVALTALWHRDQKAMWGLLFLASIMLLIFSGARGAYLGFAFAGPFTALALWGKKAVAAMAVVAVLSVPIFLATDIYETFLDNCVFRVAPVAASTGDSQEETAVVSAAGPSQTAEGPVSPATEPVSPTTEPVSPTTEPVPPTTESVKSVDKSEEKVSTVVPPEFFQFTGRKAVWDEGLDLFLDSPAIGHGFNADRILLNTHMHNAFMQALVQTGTLGTLAFVASMVFGWILLVRAMLSLNRFSAAHKTLIIQAGGIMIFLSFRGFFESSGAFFGIDWLLLAPMLFYLHVVNKPEAGQGKQ